MKYHELTAETTLDESFVSPNIGKYLKERGFRYLGGGADQRAYLEPSGQAILKIFGGDRYKSDDPKFTNSQYMFVRWAQYCVKNRNNPHLVKFAKGQGGHVWTPFVFQGRHYIQMYQEYLPRKVNSKLDRVLSDVGDLMRDTPYSPEEIEYGLSQGVPNNKNSKDFIFSLGEYYNFLQLKQVLGSGFPLFVKTLCELSEIADQFGWGLDLHGGNFRLRSDGTIVVMDPWHISGAT